MIVTKPKRPLQAIRPTDLAKPRRKAGSMNSAPRDATADKIPEFGTGRYVDALLKQDHPHRSRSTLTTTTSSISAMRSGAWLNPPHPLPDYLAHDSGLGG
jgi:hypothetical protein